MSRPFLLIPTLLALLSSPAPGPAPAPTPLPYRNLILKGGGIRGIARLVKQYGWYCGALYTVALENLNPTQPADWPRTISINTLGFGPKVRRISAGQKEQLMASGRAGVQAFFAARGKGQ